MKPVPHVCTHGFERGRIVGRMTCTNTVGAEGFEPPTAGV